MLITSINNEKIKELSKLKVKKYRDQEKKFLVEGDHLVKEAYKTNNLLEVFVLDEIDVSFGDTIVTRVTKEVLKKLSEQESSTNIIGVCKYIDEKIDNDNNIVMLDAIQDPGNLGTIIRSAAAFNYNIVLGDGSVDIYNSKVVRSTEGMIFHINFIKKNIEGFIKSNSNYKYYIADMNKGANVLEFKDNKSVALIMGNEGNGVSDSIRNIVDNYIYIPQSSKVESLNVGVAASILMFNVGGK